MLRLVVGLGSSDFDWMTMTDRAAVLIEICHEAGRLAAQYFKDQDQLVIDRKGHQDFVSQADRNVELLTRDLLAKSFPDDAIVGEEHAPKPGTSGFTWVIDPIDGTTNFVNGIPAWTVVVAGVRDGATQLGVIHDPCNAETFVATKGHGATLNGVALSLDDDRSLSEGTVGIGYSNRVDDQGILRLVAAVVSEGSMFYRNASGALSLAYVAAGRLLGYTEEHMNAWDCLAGQLIVAEAGGRVEPQDADVMIRDGGRVVVGTPAVFDRLLDISKTAFGQAD
ncbi:inositol monophosphatase family protein [uncultured Boseongicola sp.]|jgi:myo-inositol-1(or 4)-monophosphatase|uniref:inositol monophosphatase family protein n=1 Tax=uncultured Boseongicola sp. TaxID=1648499 RepID=UPI002628D851|nr:inositol monophosphatase family protein [uncultured Boseongicola sp.]